MKKDNKDMSQENIAEQGKDLEKEIPDTPEADKPEKEGRKRKKKTRKRAESKFWKNRFRN